LLRDLGYDVDLLGADMSRPDVHTCLRVRIGSDAFHVDVGFAAPFREPVRLDLLPWRIDEGINRYIFDRDTGSDRFRMAMYARGEFSDAYVVHGPPRPASHFEPAVVDSYRKDATFMRRLRIGRVFENYSVDLVDRKLYRHQAGTTTVTTLESVRDLKAAVHEELRMPRCPIESAIAILERLTSTPFYGC
jgi:arylamine N-acetyltransferase